MDGAVYRAVCLFPSLLWHSTGRYLAVGTYHRRERECFSWSKDGGTGGEKARIQADCAGCRTWRTGSGNQCGGSSGKDINLAMVKRLAEILEEAGETVIFTREDDIKVGLEERAAFANQNEADLFVSLHCNYCEDNAEVQGLECYYREDSEEGEALANQIVQAVQEEERIENRGTRTAGFRVLKKTEMPAVLVEMGYLSNSSECDK